MKKGFVYITGAGPGDPELLTIKALNTLANSDCIIYDFLANPEMLKEYDCEKIFVGKKESDHTIPQKEINALIIKKAKEGKVVTRLKVGDPFVFSRGGEEAEALADEGIPFYVIPGVSSIYSAPAYAGIPMTHRGYADSFEVISAHKRDDSREINFPEYNPDKTFVFVMGIKNISNITESLIKKKNFPETTPVAVIYLGTRPEQKVISGNLSIITDLVKKEKIKSPVIIIAGRTTALREKLRWFDTLPLFGKKIVVTRTRAQSAKFTKKLLPLGAGVIEFPTIEIKAMDDLSQLEDALKSLNEFDWLVFTSQNAVNIFFDSLFNTGIDVRSLGNIKIAAIGPASGDELLKYGLKPDLVPEEYVAESLLKEMIAMGISGKRILLPCSQEARTTLAEGLRNAGAQVERIHTYTAIIPENISQEDINEVKNADIITFTSSSTAKNFFSMVPSVKSELACIGPITAGTVKDLGFEPAIVAKEYTVQGLVKAILEDSLCKAVNNEIDKISDKM